MSRFAAIPQDIVCTLTRMSKNEICVLAYLYLVRNSRTGQCNPRQKTIAREIGMTKFAVSRAIKGLESSGVINRLDEGHFRLWKVAENATGEIPVVAEKTTKVAKITTESCTSNNSHNKEVSEQIKTCLGKEGEAGKAANHQPKRTRIPDPFPLTPGMRAWLAENINGLADIDAVHADFIEYWTNAPSGKAEKLNWELTWQRGMRLAKKWQEDNKSNGTNRLHGRPDHRTDAEILGDSAAYIISKYTNSR